MITWWPIDCLPTSQSCSPIPGQAITTEEFFASTLPLFAQFLSPLGTIRFASDVSDYADSIRDLASQEQWQLSVPPREWRQHTRYEQKGLRRRPAIYRPVAQQGSSESGRFRM